MAKQKKLETKEFESIAVGKYSIRTIYGDGRVDFTIDWDQLRDHINEALQQHYRAKLVEEAPFHPGYEGAVIKQGVSKPKKSKTKS